jgi:UDP-N-acetylmuramoyl-tripeptide--D-alanyl-D-alanine ligase
MIAPQERPILWTKEDCIKTTKGQGGGQDWAASNVSIDSRTVSVGDLFIALKGPHFDGHLFVQEALKAGAVAAIVDHIPLNCSSTDPLIVVENCSEALNNLALEARKRSSAKIIAVTGSVGKTGTKEILNIVLSQIGKTHVTMGNLNNNIGVPLSLARMAQDTDYGVFEIGMNHAGEISPLTRLVSPDIAIITAIAAVHLENFSSLEGIVDAKAEIFEGLKAEGLVILPRDSLYFERLEKIAKKRGLSKIFTFGRHIDSDCRLIDFEITPDQTTIAAVINNQSYHYHIGIAGRQWAENSLIALMILDQLNAISQRTMDSLSRLLPPKGRGKRHRLNLKTGEILIIDESYNASPISMKAAISTLGQSPLKKPGRRIAVLGDMLELGATSPELHRSLKSTLIEWGIDLVFTSGTQMKYLFDSLDPSMRGGHADTSKNLTPLILQSLHPQDVLMIKGSAGSRMGQIVMDLQSFNEDQQKKGGQ